MSARPKILVTGANGQLGRELRDLSSRFPSFDFLFTTRDELSITDTDALQRYFELYRPQFVINTAAYTAVDKAETESERAHVFANNEIAVTTIADLCNRYGAKLIHISTDYVFDGTGNHPYKEDDPTSPVNTYGLSKLMGERAALEHTDAIVIRTSWVYSSYGNNFVKTMLRLMKERESINVVNDQLGSPTYAADLAEIILQIISISPWKHGIFHFSNDGIISWYDFAGAIRELSGLSCKVIPISTDQYPTAAKRPSYSVLDRTKIQQVFGIRLKNWKDSLAECLAKM